MMSISSHYKMKLVVTKRAISICAFALLAVSASAQFPKDDPKDDLVRTENLPELKQLILVLWIWMVMEILICCLVSITQDKCLDGREARTDSNLVR